MRRCSRDSEIAVVMWKIKVVGGSILEKEAICSARWPLGDLVSFKSGDVSKILALMQISETFYRFASWTWWNQIADRRNVSPMYREYTMEEFKLLKSKFGAQACRCYPSAFQKFRPTKSTSKGQRSLEPWTLGAFQTSEQFDFISSDEDPSSFTAQLECREEPPDKPSLGGGITTNQQMFLLSSWEHKVLLLGFQSI